MKLHFLHSKKRFTDSLALGFAIMAIIQSLAEIFGAFDIPFWQNLSWLSKAAIIIGLFIVLIIGCFIFKEYQSAKGITIRINNNVVNIIPANLFNQKQWKLINFNEYFDTIVDDVVIAHSSLNGSFLDNYVSDMTLLKNVITSSNLTYKIKNGKRKYELGSIIPYNDEYLLLAFTQFDNNVAYHTHTSYEKCLFKMWHEIERVYAFKPVSIPLLGAGITRFKDTPHKDNATLLRCMLCTLKTSGIHLKKPITICLTQEIFDEINIYEFKTKTYGLQN